MKKILLFLVFLLFPLTAPAQDQVNVCADVPSILIDNGDNKVTDDNNIIQAVFNEYQEYQCLDNTAYCICFSFSNDAIVEATNQLHLNSTPSPKPIFISGLDLRGIAHPFRIEGSQPVKLLNSTFTGCSDCLSVDGFGHTIGENVSIECGNKNGIGLLLTGEDHLIKDTEVQNCGTGMQIGNAQGFGSGMTVRESKSHENGIGLALLRGHENYFNEDAVYKNGEPVLLRDSLTYLLSNDIRLAEGANGGVQNPTPLFNDEKFLSYPEGAEELGEENVTAIFRITSPYRRGTIEIVLTDAANESKEFYTAARLAGIEEIQNGLYHLRYEIPMNINVENKLAVLLFHHNSFGSTIYINKETADAGQQLLKLNGKEGVLSAAGMDTPAADGGIGGDIGGGAAGGDIGAGGGAITDPGVVPPGSDDEEESGGGSQIGSLTLTGDGTPASVITGGIGSTGAPGGVGSAKGGCSFTPGPFSANPFLFLSVAIAGFVWLRRRMR